MAAALPSALLDAFTAAALVRCSAAPTAALPAPPRCAALPTCPGCTAPPHLNPNTGRQPDIDAVVWAEPSEKATRLTAWLAQSGLVVKWVTEVRV